MKATPETIDALNAAISIEAGLMAQYGLDRRELKVKRIKKLASKMGKMKQATHCWFERLVDQLIAFGGDPSGAVLPTKVAPFTDVGALLENAYALEGAAFDFYNTTGPALRAAGDSATGHNFDHFAKWHRQHCEKLEAQLGLLKDLGKGEYLEAML